jgi:NADH-quinone oxidoreductase subunit N
MSAPVIWVLFPAVVAIALLPFRNRRDLVLGVVTGICFFLALMAWLVPLGSPMRLGPLSMQISPSLAILGRRLVLDAANRSFLILMFMFGGAWFFGSRQANTPAYFPAIGLMLIALLVAAQAVDPFLYSALILEVAVLISLPLIASPQNRNGGAMRYLIFQTLALPFILMAGWAAGLVEANPPGGQWLVPAILFLSLGFAFWLAVFPFSTWVPLLAQETSPYIFGFLLGLLPVGVLWIALGFLDSYAWLRNSPIIAAGLQVSGGLMIFSSGIWAAFQTDLRRILGYAILLENGYALLAISLNSGLGLELFAAGVVPRLVAIALWTFSLAVFQKNQIPLTLEGLSGMIRRFPFAAFGLALAYFSLGGLPLLASFPVHQPLLEALAAQSLPVVFAAGLGNLGYLLGGYRLLTRLVSSSEEKWHIGEHWLDATLLVGGILLLVAEGMFPWILLRSSLGLVQVFTHLR